MKRNFPFALKPRWEVLAASMLLCSSAGVYADTMPPVDQTESAAQSSPQPSAQSADSTEPAESKPISTDPSPQEAQSAQPAESQPAATSSESQATAPAQSSDPAKTAESQPTSTSPDSASQLQQSPSQTDAPATTVAAQPAPAATDPAPATAAAEAAGNASQAGQTPATAAANGVDTPTQPTNDKVSDIVGTFDPQGVLTPKGHFVIDPSLQFSTSSSNRVALVGYTIIPAITIGLININKVTRDSYVAALDGRYGLTNRLEFAIHVPFVYQEENTQEQPINTPSTASDIQNFTANGGGIGDVQFGFRYQFNQPDAGMPYYVGSLKVSAPTGKGPFDVPYSSQTGLETKTPTGAGFWGVQPGLTFIMPTDPAVFYGGISYQYNFSKNVDKTLFISSGGLASTQVIGDVKPGDVVEVNFGMGFGINDKASFSIGYDHNVIGRTKVNGQFGEGTTTVQVGQLLIGYSYRITPKQTINLTLGVGVTPDSPNAQITLHAPFDL
ncbi:hypothetical protein QU481_14990 [Crenobacter sp. SG2303]|uniref:Acetate kinase n=1 Tax=Crenobacter oryzisoli TaxID=3056844 RepID=A0ABT7XR36_9NEIS|nr:transporter [Crenobacter sp. SG2303]MDN0076190.1 hypothetical protein [Crenobacter sp. SG2303]